MPAALLGMTRAVASALPALTGSVAGALLGMTVLLVPAPLDAQAAPRGKATYDKWCAGCHGDTGAGDGPAAAYMLPRPRDFTKGVYQIRTTASGEVPLDADIRRIIDEGMPGTAMPGWRTLLSEAERNDLVAYLKSFSQFFANAKPNVVTVGGAPGGGADAIANGKAAYEKLECFKCHGPAGRGDGQSAPTLTDDWDHPIRAANLSQSWSFTGGNAVEQIYTRLRTGLDGTPMPSFTDAVDAKLVTDEELWQVAHYVRSLSSERAPAVREVIRAAPAEGTLPATPDDSAWADVERFWIPLVAQIIAKPRWFAPMVNGVWVQALHDGRRLALRLSWDDPSESPNAAWQEWLDRVAATMTDADGPVPTTQGSDQFSVQFPPRVTDDAERPYFLHGSARRPVHMWRWTSSPARVEVGAATGLGRFAPAGGAPEVTAAAKFDQGQWQLLLTRALAPADTARAPTFTTGVAIPIGFYAADGSNGEDQSRGAISSWYAIYLDVPTPPGVFVAPVATMLLTAGLGTLLVVRAQRRDRGLGRNNQEES